MSLGCRVFDGHMEWYVAWQGRSKGNVCSKNQKAKQMKKRKITDRQIYRWKDGQANIRKTDDRQANRQAAREEEWQTGSKAN